MRSGQRVFVTGIGIVSPCGNDFEAAFNQVCEGSPALEIIDADEGRAGEAVVAGRAEFSIPSFVPRLRTRLMDRSAQMGLAAGDAALRMAGWSEDERRESAVYTGCAYGGTSALEGAYRDWYEANPVRPASVPMIMSNAPAAHLSIEFGIAGPSHNTASACVSSALAIGEAFRKVRDGYSERVLAGGMEAKLEPATLAAWSALGVLAKVDGGTPGLSSRPFDQARTGLVLAEGAAMLTLESEESLDRAGRTPLAEVVGYGARSDGHALTKPHVDGQLRTMKAALEDAGLEASEIDYLNAHATGTPFGDPVEVEAIRSVFGGELPVSSAKGVHGHLVGAAGALEAVWTVCALRTGRIPPTANLHEVGDDCSGLRLPTTEERGELEYALSNSFAFGGSNASLIFRRA